MTIKDDEKIPYNQTGKMLGVWVALADGTHVKTLDEEHYLDIGRDFNVRLIWAKCPWLSDCVRAPDGTRSLPKSLHQAKLWATRYAQGGGWY